MFDGAGRCIPRLLDLPSYTGRVIAKGIGKTQYVLTQMVLQESFALHNFTRGFGWKKEYQAEDGYDYDHRTLCRLHRFHSIDPR